MAWYWWVLAPCLLYAATGGFCGLCAFYGFVTDRWGQTKNVSSQELRELIIAFFAIVLFGPFFIAYGLVTRRPSPR
ncbi:MAG: hypothetical protein G01um101419_241 [Parcubacteria group bacterium Gr01-1014_19]|nr:MAG: hypothetical protein G01um101419_241 [Parcubacteria group bacterium Gr01-1014_19]